MCLASSSSRPPRRAAIATYAPSAASASAVASPIPDEAPVTSATLPSNLPAMTYSSLSCFSNHALPAWQYRKSNPCGIALSPYTTIQCPLRNWYLSVIRRMHNFRFYMTIPGVPSILVLIRKLCGRGGVNVEKARTVRWESFPLPSLKGLRTSFLTPAQNQE